jgi:hypothetical protein
MMTPTVARSTRRDSIPGTWVYENATGLDGEPPRMRAVVKSSST